MSYSTKVPTVPPPSYANLTSDSNQTVLPGADILLDQILYNTADITFGGAFTAPVTINTTGIYKVSFVVRPVTNVLP